MIEEPPADTIFIFVVEQIELMLNTILSRTQIVKLPPISDEDMIEYLTKALPMHPDQALRVARIAEGNLNSALALAHSDGNAYEQLLQKWLSTSIRLIGPHAAESSVQLQALTDEFAALGREHQKAFVKYALWFLREIALLNNGLTSEKLFGNELTFATREVQALNVDKLLAIQKKLNDLHYHIERNANPKIAFYGISFELYRIFYPDNFFIFAPLGEVGFALSDSALSFISFIYTFLLAENQWLKAKTYSMSCGSCGSKDGKVSGCGSGGSCSSGGCNRSNVFDWFSFMPTSFNENCNIVEISFKKGARKGFYRNTGNLDL